MKILFSEEAWDEYLSWQRDDKKMVIKINRLIDEIRRNPFEGTGKPEALRYEFTGWWSRRIDSEHRLIYRIVDDRAEITQCRYHY